MLQQQVRRLHWALGALSLLVLLLLGLVITWNQSPPRPSAGDFTAAIAKMSPSVVNIYTPKMRNDECQGDSVPLDGVGSGIVFHEDGYIVTNYHVVANAPCIRIVLYDHRVFAAELIGLDPRLDIGILKIAASDLPAAPIAAEPDMAVGDSIIAIGNPYGLTHSASMGIISAIGRTNVGLTGFDNFIQTDAAINPGNSGGALINRRGELLGINNVFFSDHENYRVQGISFAIPIAEVSRVFFDIYERYQAFADEPDGLTIQSLPMKMVDSREVKYIDDKEIFVVTASGRNEFGLLVGDWIVGINGLMPDLGGGEPLTLPEQADQLVIVRAGETVTLFSASR